MHSTERLIFAIRHHRFLQQADWLWKFMRPLYDRVSSFTGRKGLVRVINGTDTIRVAWWQRGHLEEYEPDVWQSLMSQVNVGDRIADVGAFVGLYAIALAKRVGASGRIFAFEPDPANYDILQEHVRLNDVAGNIELVKAAVGASEGVLQFSSLASQSHIEMSNEGSAPVEGAYEVKAVTLDSMFAADGLDILKIDVEGFEEMVLQGGTRLLADAERKPRVIFVEVHPYAWPPIGTTSESLLETLRKFDYEVKHINGERVERIEEYGEVIAYRITP
jgi:FkbM family methyltransferase